MYTNISKGKLATKIIITAQQAAKTAAPIKKHAKITRTAVKIIITNVTITFPQNTTTGLPGILSKASSAVVIYPGMAGKRD